MPITLNGSSGIIGAVNSMTAQNSTSGTSIDFTSIPAGVRRITVMFYAVSTSGASNAQIQLGAGSVTTSGYNGTSQASTAAGNSAALSTTGFVLLGAAGASVFSGIAVFTNITTNIWVGSVSLGQTDSARSMFTNAHISLGGALDRVRITTVNGTDTLAEHCNVYIILVNKRVRIDLCCNRNTACRWAKARIYSYKPVITRPRRCTAHGIVHIWHCICKIDSVITSCVSYNATHIERTTNCGWAVCAIEVHPSTTQCADLSTVAVHELSWDTCC